MKHTLSTLFANALAVAALLTAQAAEACTGIRLIARNGDVVFARTLEFATDIKSEVIMVPRGFARTGTAPGGKAGMRWTSRYASLGANGEKLPFIFDGLNEKGLAVGTFYFPGSAGFQKFSAASAGRTLAPWELGSWLLESFASVEEVRRNIGNVVVADVIFPAWGFTPPVHYIVNDASGKSIVIEYIGGKLQVHDNPLGVMANSPSFDWHMTNLRNYVNFSLTNPAPVTVGGVKLQPLGMGAGMLGLPGDFTPPSRFVRAVAFSTSVEPGKTGDDAVLEAFHALNNFDIPKGAAREGHKDEHGNVLADYTLWTSANDLARKRFLFRTFENSQIRSVDLMKLDLNASTISRFSMQGKERIQSLNP
ncbi:MULTISPECIES: choloylglycine hydrolase family protein [unclassified Synechococcus]|uniref:choloylglycine hydrolase family protein n=1 Tax=unclassified Synechococcus TaxID=2626047 RepID=UPI0021A9268A|nr:MULTISPECIES: choloylglycine hydrolase family protein [unclassified Synechococcus]MCT0213251.1 choloylglycine hydrolase family protein [Synechococcus sp. CS-1326]MCT0231936.1 choloylglycine hydrolase family protein [Synechococcus sp. CS-1327]